MHIDYLCDHPELIEELAELNFKEWSGFRPGDTLAARTERMRAACGKGAIPMSWWRLRTADCWAARC